MSGDLTRLTIRETSKGLKSGAFTSLELTTAYLGAIDQHSHLNAFITVMADQAIERAKASDERIKSGATGMLEGIPLAIKDLFCTEGTRTTAGSQILSNFVPPYESTVTSKLLDSGAVFLGKTNLDEFAMGSSNITSHYGPVINPWGEGTSKDLVPGGSSGGSAAAVAANLCAGATGTDTGGSVRQPASFCGIVGMKPTYGRCSRFGIVAFASSLDQAGPMARSVDDCALLMEVMSGHDPKDSTSADMPAPKLLDGIDRGVSGLRIGIPKDYRIDDMPAEIDAVWSKGIEWLRSEGAEIVDISLPNTRHALPAYYIIGPAEASSNLSRYDGMRFGVRYEGDDLVDTYMKTRGKGFGSEVKRRVFIGTYVLSAGYFDAYYLKAQRIRRKIINEFREAFDKVDVLLTPTAPSTAFAIGERQDDPIAMYLNDVFTVPANLAGLPGLSIPAELAENGLPLGLQVIGSAWDEATVLQVGKVIEACADFSMRPAGVGG